MTEEEKKAIPKMTTNSNDIIGLMELFAAAASYEAVAMHMEKRFRSIPNGWRDLKMLEARARTFADEALYTVPAHKLEVIKRTLPMMKFKIQTVPQAVKIEKGYVVVPTDDIELFCQIAHDHCILCDHPNDCKRCDIGKLLDKHVLYERGNSSWCDIDLSIDYEKLEGEMEHGD